MCCVAENERLLLSLNGGGELVIGEAAGVALLLELGDALAYV